MPFGLSTTAILAIFYVVFLGQILLLSVYYPGRFIGRIRYVLDHFPAADYPNLYPDAGPDIRAVLERKLRIFRGVNTVIALFGLAVLVAMAVTGYQPKPKGGDESFVLAYFFLQAMPFLVASILEQRHLKAMRRAFKETKRTAALRPRRLFDFVSPLAVLLAAVCFGAWIVFYLSIKGWNQPWGWEVYVTVGMTTLMNVIYAGIVAHFLYGKKQNPYLAGRDQLKTIGATIKILVYSSIGISLFNMTSVAADHFAFEVFDPALSSLYVQFCAVLGFGIMLGMVKLEDVDFEVYRKDTATRPA